MARTVNDIVIDAPAKVVMEVIADFAAYPEWATGMKSTDIVAVGPDGRATDVRFALDSPPIRDEFTLRYRWSGDSSVSWCLADSEGIMLSAMDGSYQLDVLSPEQTRVTYQLSVDVKIPLLGMLKRKAEKVIVDTALKGLKKRVESR